jgi:hypothetical protein
MKCADARNLRWKSGEPGALIQKLESEGAGASRFDEHCRQGNALWLRQNTRDEPILSSPLNLSRTLPLPLAERRNVSVTVAMF